MRSKVSISIMVIINMTIVSLTQAQTLQEIISRHFEARGGLDKIKSLHSVIMRGHSVSDQFQIPINFYCIQEKAFKVEMEYEGRKYFQMGTTSEGWSYSPDQVDSTPQPMSAEDLEKGKPYFDLQGPFIDYEKKGIKVEYRGRKDIDGKKLYELKVTRNDSTGVCKMNCVRK